MWRFSAGPLPLEERLVLCSIIHDITDRLKSEKALARSKNEWEKTFDAMSDIITIQDENMHIVRANKAAHRLFHASPGELNGRYCYEVFRGAAGPCQGCPLVETSEDTGYHTNIMKHENLGKIFQVSSNLIPSENGDPPRLLHIARDITAQKQLEEELFQSHKMEAIGTLAGGIAHDFNNILTAIIGFSELAKENLPPGSQAGKDIEVVLESAARAVSLVKQILTFSRKRVEQLQPMMPHLIVKEALKMLRASLPATISLLEEIDSECGLILADPTNVHQIVVNLCTNAYQAMANEKGALRVALSREVLRARAITAGGVAAGPFIVLSVSDTGQGMDQKTIKQIFDPFFTTKPLGKGTGLGLAVIAGIVKDYKGFIRVQSAPGKGATIEVCIPALAEPRPSQAKIPEAGPRPGGTERILLVDDERVVVDLHQKVLERLGYVVTGATDSREALEKFRAAPDRFDLLITDQTMPNLSGVELAREILKIKPALPIVICTGYSGILSEEDALAVGIKAYLRKPVDLTKITRLVRSMLDGK